MTDRELLTQALEALETCSEDEWYNDDDFGIVQVYDEEKITEAITALRERLAQPEQEPVAWMQEMPTKGDETRSVRLTTVESLAREEWPNPIPLYTTPPRREWVGLNDGEADDLSREMVKGKKSVNWLTYAIEAKLREKNQ